MRKALLFLSIIVVLAGAHRVSACACRYSTPADGFDTSGAVFAGRVTKAGKSKWFVAVSRVWKGEVKATILLKDRHAKSSCRSRYDANESYLFLVRSETKGERTVYFTRPCIWSVKLKNDGTDPTESGGIWTQDLILQGRGEGRPPSEN